MHGDKGFPYGEDYGDAVVCEAANEASRVSDYTRRDSSFKSNVMCTHSAIQAAASPIPTSSDSQEPQLNRTTTHEDP